MMRRLFNPNDFFGRNQAVTLALVAVLICVAGAF